ncbi:tRNA lysidine(34) synthetase TilS [Saccharophagus degradans]|uniref:tRNA lysidine(34) synthetase TilS n=1 Tax=Saccharophagus degradans TaxID=86304 RepID=UPI002477E0D2|nr:tRNA lysidine(34) synthetase TilS [Saccharophagus degradans]WGO97308.1 tRNA lysidine(34) synthetase TilS [Saccharophagus degradans]
MNEIEREISAQITALSAQACVWVAFSGGLDSTVLLHALSVLGVKCHAVHVNHGLSINADNWQRQCSVFASQREIAFTAVKVIVLAEGCGIEEAARVARYNAIENLLAPSDVLLTGHHRDDQIETFFLRLMRGAGLRGLGAMRRTRSLSQAILVRPLLNISRQSLHEYALQQGLTWIEDESNLDTHYDRNLLRQTFVPQLKARWPQVEKNVETTVQHLQAAEDLLQEYAAADLALCESRQERLGSSIALNPMQTFSKERSSHILRSWLASLGYKLPDTARMVELHKLIAAKDDAAPLLNIGNYSLCRFQQRLYCLPRTAIETECTPHTWNPIEPLHAADGSELRFTAASDNMPVFEVAYRQGGERCKPVGRGHSQTLKKLLQEYGLEPWLRAKVPLIYYQGNLIAVGDLWLCEAGEVVEGHFEWGYFERSYSE